MQPNIFGGLRFGQFVRYLRLWLALILIATLISHPMVFAQADDDWIVVYLHQVEVRDGQGNATFMITAPHGTGHSGIYSYPDTGTVPVGPGSVVRIDGGIAVRKPTSDVLPVYLGGITSNQPPAVVEQGVNLISGFISDMLGSRLVDVLRINPEFLWSWFASQAFNAGLHAVYNAMVINPENDHALLLLTAQNNWLADGQQHTITSAQGRLIFTYEVRIAHQATVPDAQPNDSLANGVTAINETGQTLCEFFVVPRRNVDWGANLIAVPLSPGARIAINIRGEVKYRAKNCAGNTVAEEGKLILQPGQTLHIHATKH